MVALQMMRFAEVASGDIKAHATPGSPSPMRRVDERKRIFARQLLSYVPLAAHIRRVLDERQARTARKSRFFDELEDYMTDEAAEQNPARDHQLGPLRRNVRVRRRERRFQPRESDMR